MMRHCLRILFPTRLSILCALRTRIIAPGHAWTKVEVHFFQPCSSHYTNSTSRSVFTMCAADPWGIGQDTFQLV